MFVRFIAPLAAILVLLNSASAFAQDGVAGSRYEKAFTYLQQRGAVQGGRLSDPLNRVDALKVVLDLQERTRTRVEWFRTHQSSLPLFRDVAQGSWYAPYVEAGFELGIVTGYPDVTFRPGSLLRSEEAIALLIRAYGVRSGSAAGADWYVPYVQDALSRNLVASSDQLWVGYGLTRGQFFEMAYRMDSIVQGDLVAFADNGTPVGTGPRILLPSQQQPVRTATIGQYRPPVVQGPSPVGTTPSTQQSFSISIPNLGINNLTVTHPADALTSKGQLAVLKNGVGHLFSYPGRGGKIMIYGHSSSYSWDVSKFTKIFTKVNELKPGDKVYVTYNGQQFTYEVTRQQTISPNDITPFTGRGEELILYTCWPVGTAKSRLIVHAVPVVDVAQR